ncbi:MAG TPA: hypothetical protein PLD10_18775 [Rhodopila sp.]|nr:hypothetical protein [Rhodopila sp.]
MLGDIVGDLTAAETAETVVVAVGRPDTLARIRDAAAADGIPAGALIAAKVCHLLDHGTEEIWLDLLGLMRNSPQPGIAAVERLLDYAFPDPVRVRISRSHA